ncbi:glutaredoxin domain-containing protein [Actinoplanes friuliensis]|uniref:glutaredoxin domain-containing protein n=1 Tax=Actinoplanes friuliensis TaxID=196914 RepID=UPI000693A1A5|nr:glutaredoxin domain-containing protein [Actinoplanes friuliensis]
MLRRWTLAGAFLLAGAAAAIVSRSLPTFVIFVALAALASPLVFPRSTPAPADAPAIIYWRPGCPFCMRLRATLGRTGRKAHWIDIWSDPDAAAAVRAVANGNETVPTVILAGVPHVNPDPLWLRRELAAA